MSNNDLTKLLQYEGLTRRRFMQHAAALGITASAASVFWGQSVRAAEPQKGGTFRLGIGHGSTTDSLDPATFENLYMQVVGSTIYNCLTEVANDGSLVPELAESWDVTEDAKTWTFKLRPGVTFHNGKTMDAGDVIASFQHHMGEDSKSGAKPIVEQITDIKADGDDKVAFTLKEGNADFPFIVSDYHLAILPATDGKVDATAGIGTGGYTIATYDPGVRTDLKRFETYWKPDRAHFDAAQVLVIIDPAARTNALTTGEIDAMDRVDLKTAHLLKRNRSVKIEEVSGTQHYTFAMRCDIAPFDNNDVRLALKNAIDREALVKTILRGHGVVGNDHPIGQSNRFHADDLEQRTYDPEKAKYHLKQAGLSELKVDLSAADAAFPGAVDAAVLYREHAAKAGIDINVVREPNDGYWSNVWLKKPFCAVYWGGRPTEDWMFSTAYAKGVPWNDTHWDNDAFNKLLIEARAELDEDKRRQMYYEMQELCRDDGGTIIPMFANYVMATSDKVGHDELGANWSLDGFRCIERWWFAG
ncbi:peptide/nickel transport system substrate-binding protein [Rhodobium orientis]|uniref:Peptide ABC transporter substrate-binding protein n=1 Tax=Rhodobium orientis TaxID=34017 RepID=A0A327JM29_9HYPH|nr:ABC transporter substrate-binding protein [Rhodobium orientis]MBB4302016.1 peptide/nickel transport system substrate-binding protein [Rhodobium orientis]MBK5950253.1 peptide ABC transporter substrate-binding protein [Rhodobium orientis]RAI27151.1 peptide ABC transporter substrate-binding protein [Rhodobium orientis]